MTLECNCLMQFVKFEQRNVKKSKIQGTYCKYPQIRGPMKFVCVIKRKRRGGKGGKAENQNPKGGKRELNLLPKDLC